MGKSGLVLSMSFLIALFVVAPGNVRDSGLGYPAVTISGPILWTTASPFVSLVRHQALIDSGEFANGGHADAVIVCVRFLTISLSRVIRSLLPIPTRMKTA